MLQSLAALCGFLYVFLKISDTDAFPPPLSPEEEAECFRKMKNGDREARKKLIKHNLRLVAHIVKKYYSTSDQEELISTGTIGLIKAVDTFDPDNGTRFATYACRCLQNEILMQFRAQKKYQNEVSVNDTIDTDKDGNPLTYGDIISTDEDIVDLLDLRFRTKKVLECVMNGLTERERKIMILRYGIGGGRCRTQRETAEKLGISRSYVSRIEKSALDKLRSYMKKSGYV
ncbi:MAG: RNA polymerase sporulation sigma factor SigK [Clostridia bacterium]|nr:RNA polymerase sporulation sigma factor SigK [Clostridia bacterium]